MTKLEQAARQALGALEVATTPLAKDRQEVLRAITALREALSEVQALSAAPAGFVPVAAFARLHAHAESLAARLLAASPTPPAEQQAQPGAVYAELPQPDSWFHFTAQFWENKLRDFADRTHALRMQAAPKAAPTRTALPDGWTDCTIEFGNDGPEVVAYGPKRMMTRLAKWLGKYFAQVIAEAAPKAAPEVGISGFDYKTAADFLNGKTVSDEAVRTFVAASRWAHDERAALSATLLAMHGVLTSREAEIALLKKALLEAEAAPQPSPAPLSESIDQLERKLAIIAVVGVIDGHDVVRRESVLEIARRAALAAQGGRDAG